MNEWLPFLRIPPFPGHRASALAIPRRLPALDRADTAALADALVRGRVGGKFWAAQPTLPSDRDVLLFPKNRSQADAMSKAAANAGIAGKTVIAGKSVVRDTPCLGPDLDPWHVVAQASAVWADADDENALVAALCDVPLRLFGTGRFSALSASGREALHACVARMVIQDVELHDPFGGGALTPDAAIALLTGWRALIDANRQIVAAFGIAGWKRETLSVLLWDGTGAPRYVSDAARSVDALAPGDVVLAWKAKVAADFPAKLEARGVHVGEIEDGMVRSSGLGADCVPPLSIVVDLDGAHFDPARPSTLESLLQHGVMDAGDLERAAALRARLIDAGISKYGRDATVSNPVFGTRRRVLVTGQVEDDRSILLGGAGCSNHDLVRRAREIEPDSYIIYKPHPDVEAGHRKGHVPDTKILAYANEVDRQSPIQALLGTVAGVHVITSLSGFEALMRGKDVTTHGVPFYAGWGLTRDMGPVPGRRTRKLTLDELVAATLIRYPRYLDPVTMLPCPVEVLVQRLATDQARLISPLVSLRRAQGRFKRIVSRFRGEIE